MSKTGQYFLDTGVVGALGFGGELADRIDSATEIRASPMRPMISVVTRCEIAAFMHDKGWGETRRSGVENLLKNLVMVGIDDPRVWQAFAELKIASKSIGRAIGDNDLWIAATARVVGAKLLTTDKDFDPPRPTYVDRIYFQPKV